MPKRQAVNQLTHENWDDPEDKEAPATFNKITDEELSNRVIKQAKRRCAIAGNTTQSSSPFASFKGFGSKVESSTSENGDIKPSQRGSAMQSSSPFASFKGFGTKVEASTSENGDVVKPSPHGNGNVLTKEPAASKSEGTAAHQKSNACRDLEYYRLLKCLNESLVNWVTQHLSKNPLCDFTPVFSDYKRHLEGLEAKFPVREEGNTVSADKLKKESSATNSLSQPSKLFDSSMPTSNSGIISKPENSNTNSSAASIFGSSSTKECSSTAQSMLGSSSLFSVSKSVVAASNTAVVATGFQFGNVTNCSSSKPSVSISSVAESGKVATSIFTKPVSSTAETKPSILPTAETKPFSFASSVVQSNEEKEDTAEENEDSEEPPKNEFTPVVEKDAVYSKRCKLFYNKEGNFVGKGVGTLYLKPLNGKTQLLIRADTNLGNILLNILLNSSLPVQRVGKNNVLIVCIPNPPLDPSKENGDDVVQMLIRVKTEDDANELFKQIEESKSS